MTTVRVFAVHAVRPDEICACEVVWTQKDKADSYARDLSTDPGVFYLVFTAFLAVRAVSSVEACEGLTLRVSQWGPRTLRGRPGGSQMILA